VHRLRNFKFVLVMVAGLLGCHEKIKAPSAAEQETAKVEAPVVEEEKPKAKDSRGQTCRDDRECTSYLRCIDGLCEEPPAMSGKVQIDTPRAIFQGPDGKELATFHLELAVAPYEQSRGLMYRRSMRPDWGMLFIYRRDEVLTFWMRNTLIPLDMVFLDASGTVQGVVRAEPLTETPRSVNKPGRYVLELNAGTAEKFGIAQGAQMKLEHVDPEYTP